MNPMWRIAGFFGLAVTILKIIDYFAPNVPGVSFVAANAPIFYALAFGIFLFGFTRHWLIILGGVVAVFLLLTEVGF
jgi:hypothetical protein